LQPSLTGNVKIKRQPISVAFLLSSEPILLSKVLSLDTLHFLRRVKLLNNFNQNKKMLWSFISAKASSIIGLFLKHKHVPFLSNRPRRCSMIFILVCLIFVAVSIVVLRKTGVLYPYSKGIGLAIGLSLLAVVCLAQNYTQSLIPEANDGIAISNQIAYFIIGKDGWSQDLYENVYTSDLLYLDIICNLSIDSNC
jgi:hypothetical protein